MRADDGTVHRYDKLIIATGSSPFFPPIPGLLDDGGRPRTGVFGFRTIADTEQMLDWGHGGTRAAVIGGGLLGLEAARGLLERGLEVHVVQRASRLMNLQLDGQAGAILRRGVEDLGIHVHLDTRTNQVDIGEDGRVTGLQFADGSELECDVNDRLAALTAAGTSVWLDQIRRSRGALRRSSAVSASRRWRARARRCSVRCGRRRA